MVRAGFRLPLTVGLAAVAAGAGLAGCGTDKKDAEPKGGPSATKTATAAKSPTPTATPTPQAADGKNLRACKDGACEVKVTRPVRIRMDEEKLELAAVKVTSLKSGAVSFEMVLPSSGSFDFSCDVDPKCETFVVSPAYGSPGMGRITAHPGAVIKANGVIVQVVTAAKGSAILRMKPR